MRPALRAVRMTGVWLALGILAACWNAAVPAWQWGGLLLGAVLLVDLVLLWRRTPLAVERRIASSLAVGARVRVRLRIANEGRRVQTVDVFDGVPASAEFRGLPRTVSVPAGEGVEVEYRLRMISRGNAVFAAAELLRTSPLGFWRARERAGGETRVQVYPDFATVARFALLAVEHRESAVGIRRRQRRGTGLDFHQLREYREGDMLRHVDWRATSRRRKLISREYQEERDQNVLFLVDCGRRMRSIDEDLTHFDHCLNAVLLVAYIALRQGDAAGLLTFSGEDRWVKPAKGRHTLSTILNQTYDLETTLAPSDYLEAARRTMTLQKRRALVCVLTNLREEDTGDLLPALDLLRRRHLVIVASLRESAIDALLDRPVSDFDDAIRTGGARHYLAGRHRSIESVRGRNLLALDLVPRDLPVALANQYLDLKRSGRL